MDVIFNEQVLVFAERKEVISDKLVYAERKEVLLIKQKVCFAETKKMMLNELILYCAV
jgi:hypothetical protein